MRSAAHLKQPANEFELSVRRCQHAALLGRIAKVGDRSAFEELFVFFGPRLKGMMMKGGADVHAAEDLTQEVMLTIWRKAALYAPAKGSVSTWVFTIARNLRIDRLRKQSPYAYEDIEALKLESAEIDGENAVMGNQTAEHVAQALKQLPATQRKIVELAFIHDMPQSRIAEKLELPLGTVKSRMRLAYGKLRLNLEELQ